MTSTTKRTPHQAITRTVAVAASLALAAVTLSVAGPAAAATPARPVATSATTTSGGEQPLSGEQPLNGAQRAVLRGIATDTWSFFTKDIDPVTHLPLDNLGPGDVRGTYTSAANVGVYLEAVVSALDLRLISRPSARTLIADTLTTVSHLQRSHGFLYQWYDTTTGDVIRNPGDIRCATETTPTQDNCFFLSAVDNGWYASGLIVARQALPELQRLINPLVNAMDFSIFYDNRAQTSCNTNPAIEGNQPTGQMYGGYYVDQGPAGYHNGALYSDPRIAMYIGMGLHQMPGDVWWRTWRTLPPQQCSTDPDFSWQGQKPAGYWQTYRDPQSGKSFRVWEGHYVYPGTDLSYIPTWGGGMFEGLMANEIVPETTWGTRSFGLADVRTAQVQQRYATDVLHYPVWGLSPSSTADDTGDYATYGVEGLALPAGEGLSQCTTCASETTVTPHASFLALTVTPRAAYANIAKLRSLYPSVYSSDGGFFDAVDPSTGAVGHRRLVLDQSMIMMGLADALSDHAIQRAFAKDPVSWAARTYLSMETMSLR